MPEARRINFTPKWYSSASAEIRTALDDVSSLGRVGSRAVRVLTRILPLGDHFALPATIVGEVIDVTQKLMQYAANDAIKGYNPDFADLRSIGQDVAEISKLTVEPFESGSFVIPTRLDADEFQEGTRRITTEAIVVRFHQILEEVSSSTSPQVSIGALQAASQLKSTLSRTAEAIEYEGLGPTLETTKHVVNLAFIEKVHRTITSRRPSEEVLDELIGVVKAIDLDNQELQIQAPNQRPRVKGAFHTMLHPTLLTSLGKKVKLYGRIIYRANRIYSIAILEAELIND